MSARGCRPQNLGPESEAMRSPGVTNSSMAATTPSSAEPRRGDAIGRTSVAVLLVLSVLAIFFARAMPDTVQFLHRDTGRAHEPMKRYVAAEIAQGRFPEWNPFSGLGTPLVVGAIDAVQHPLNLLLILPFALGFKLWVLLSYALAATGAMAWARVLGRSVPASVGAGLAFGMSGFLVGQSNNLTYLTAYAAIPWVFASARVWFERGTPGALALLGLSSALLAAAGDPQGWGIALLLVPVLGPGGPVSSSPSLGTGVRRAIVGIVAGAVAAAPFILPVLAWLPHSERAIPQLFPETIQRWNLHPWRLAELPIPNLFWSDLGATLNPVFAAFAGNEWTGYPWVPSVYVSAACLALAVTGSTTSRFARMLIAGAIVATWAAMGPHLGFWALASHVPVLRGFRYWEKIAIWATLFLSVGAAFGVDAAASSTRSARLLRYVAAVAGAIALVLSAVLWAAPGSAAALLTRDGMPGVAEGLVARGGAGGTGARGLVQAVRPGATARGPPRADRRRRRHGSESAARPERRIRSRMARIGGWGPYGDPCGQPPCARRLGRRGRPPGDVRVPDPTAFGRLGARGRGAPRPAGLGRSAAVVAGDWPACPAVMACIVLVGEVDG